MELHEWALIIFTIFTQMSVGSFLVLGIVHSFASRKAGIEEADRLSDRALIAIIVVLGLGMIASLFHLGNPLRAYRAVTNLGTSWLSREILLGVIFTVLGAVFAFLQWRKLGGSTLRSVIAWIAALVGVGFVYSMSRVYMLATQPAWNTWATPLTFYATTLLLGSLAVGAAFIMNYALVQRQEPTCADTQSELMRGALRWIAISAVVLVGIEMVVLPLYFAYLSNAGVIAAASISLFGNYSLVFLVRLLLLFIGAGVFGMFLFQNASSPGREKIMGNLAYGAFLLVLVAEVLGRFLFYATQVQITI